MAEQGRLKRFKKVLSKDRTVNQLQNNVEQVLQPVLAAAMLDGVLLKDICLTAGVTNEITHKLGRSPIGWIIFRQREDSRIWDMQDTNPQPTSTLSLACSHEVTIDVWIF